MLAEIIGIPITRSHALPANPGHALTGALDNMHAILGGFLIWPIGGVWPTPHCRSSPACSSLLALKPGSADDDYPDGREPARVDVDRVPDTVASVPGATADRDRPVRSITSGMVHSRRISPSLRAPTRYWRPTACWSRPRSTTPAAGAAGSAPGVQAAVTTSVRGTEGTARSVT